MSYIYYISPVGVDPNYRDKREILKGIALEVGIDWFFPLERRNSFSVDDAVKDLQVARVVLADLSLERPSCYFELGLAQALGASVSLIAARGTKLHQAGGTDNVVVYDDLGSYGRAIKQCLARVKRGDA